MLISDTGLRPADILTQALGNTVITFVMGIMSLDSIRASVDCTASMFQCKMDYHCPISAS